MSRSAATTVGLGLRADVAQLVEHLHGKEGVRGSSPLVGLLAHSLGIEEADVQRIGGVSSAQLGDSRKPRRATLRTSSVNVLPSPVALSNVIEPSIASASAREMWSPRPVPSI
jgi:hypothetical protein